MLYGGNEGADQPVLWCTLICTFLALLQNSEILFKCFDREGPGLIVWINSSLDRHSGSVVEHPLCDQEVAGSIPGRVIPKILKMVLAALSLGAQHEESRARNRNWSAHCQYNATGWNIMSKCLGHDISVRQHSKSEHWAPCHIQTPSR